MEKGTVLNRFALAVVVFCGWVSVPTCASAATIEFIVSRVTGEISLHNPGAQPFGILAYSITSTVNALDGSDLVWTSIADTYDFSGDKSVDPDDEWVEFLPSSTNLAEGEFDGNGGSLASDQTVSLGMVWDISAAPGTLSAEVVESSGQFATVLFDFRSFDGDYDNDLDVDNIDYTIWRNSYGSTVSLDADGNHDGIIDAADYTVWRDNFPSSLPPGAGSSVLPLFITAVPEPTSALLLIVGSGALLGILAWKGQRVK